MLEQYDLLPEYIELYIFGNDDTNDEMFIIKYYWGIYLDDIKTRDSYSNFVITWNAFKFTLFNFYICYNEVYLNVEIWAYPQQFIKPMCIFLIPELS